MIEIKGISYKMRYSLRALVIYEELKKESSRPGGIMDEMILYYSAFVASNPETNVTFDDFFEAVDNDINLLSSLRKWMKEEVETLFQKTDADDKKKASPQKKSIKN